MRLEMPSLRICFEWKFVGAHSVSFAATKPMPLTLADSLEPPPPPPPLSVESYMFYLSCSRTDGYMNRIIMCSARSYLYFIFGIFLWKKSVRHSVYGRSVGRSVCLPISSLHSTIAYDIRIRISAAHLYACVCVTVETMRNEDREREKDFVAAYNKIWSLVYETDVSENEHMNRCHRRSRRRRRCLANSHIRKSSRTHTCDAPPTGKDFSKLCI